MKKYTHLYILFLSILTLLTFGAQSAWGKDCKVVVGVGSGKGKAKVELWQAPFWGDSKVVETEYVSNGEGTKDKTGDVARTTDVYAKYIAEAATGYSFSSWHKDDATCTNAAAASGTSNATWSTGKISAKNSPTFTYYAKFTPNNYTITLNNQSATTAGTASITATFDAVPASITIPTKTSKVFDGYYTAVNGGGSKIIDGNGNVVAGTGTYTDSERKWVYADNITLYANWVDKLAPSVTCAKTALSVDEQLTSAFTFVNTSGITFEVINTVIGSEINNGDGKVIEYDAANNKIIAHNAGTATLRFTQAETSTIKSETFDFDFTVTKHTPSFTWNAGGATYYYQSSIAGIFSTTGTNAYTIVSNNEAAAKVEGVGTTNTLRVYNVKEAAEITVTQVENYYWTEKIEKYTVTPVNQTNHVPFTVNNANKGVLVVDAESHSVWNEDNGYKMGDGGIIMKNTPYSYIIIQFTGIPDKLTFKATCDKVGIGLASSYPVGDNYYFDVYESTTNGDWGDAIWSNPRRSTSYSDVGEQDYTVQLQATTRYVKLCYHGTCYGHFRNIHISELHQFTSDPKTTLDFGTEGLKYGEQTKYLAFIHANAGRSTSVEITGEDANYFRVAPTTIAGTGRDLYGTSYLGVTFDNVYNEVRRDKGDNAYNATLIIYDNDSTRSVALTGKRFGKSYPKFTFNPNSLPYYFESTIANVASSSNTDYANCPLTFETSNSNIAEVIDGTLHIYSIDEAVTITVRQNKGNEDYYSGSATFTFTPRERPNLAVPFFVNKGKYDEGILSPGEDAGMAWNSDPNNEIRLGDGWVLPTSWGKKSFVVEFSGTPDKVSFQYKTNKKTTSSQFGDGDILKAPIWTVEESANGSDWTQAWRDVNNSNSYSAVTECALKENTRFLRFTYNGNGYGYFKNIKVTELVGYKYLRAADGEYLSRGGKWATQAVTDAFGIPCRLTNETADNEHSYSRFQYVDNKEYLYETDAEIFTDNKTANSQNALWHVDYVDGTLLKLRSANTAFGKQGYYVTNSEGAMALTSNAEAATLWVMEDYTEHGPYMASIFDEEAAAAAREEFGSDVNTRAKVHNCLTTEDFEKEVISIETVSPAQRSTEGEFRNGVSGARDVYDFVKTGLTPGFYILSVKALFRVAPSETAWENHKRGTESVVAYAYANDVKYPIQSVYASYHASQIEESDELRDGYYYSTTLSSATTAFADANRYTNDIYVQVGEDGTLRYGLKCPSYVPGAWLAYADVTLTRVARKQYIFNGTEGETWVTDGSWNRGSQPNIHHEVIIDSDVVIESEVAAYSVTINEGKKVTIAPTGGLTVGAGGVRGATTDNLILKACTEGAIKGQTAYLRISPYTTRPMPEATVELLNQGYYNASVSGHQDIGTWQYVGSPMVGGELAKNVFTSGMIYDWNEAKGAWKNNRRNLVLAPFTGYAISQYKEEGLLISNKGTLVDNGTVVLPLTYTEESATPGCNVFANSFSAPIDITAVEPSDFSEGVEASIHLFNTGSKADVAANELRKTIDVNAPGQYISIPVSSAKTLGEEFGYPTTIPSMQGFYVNTDRDGTLTLNYEKLVWNADVRRVQNRPLRVKANDADEEQPVTAKMMVSVYTENMCDNFYLLQSDSYDVAYENGYDATKKMSCAFNVFAIEEDNIHLAVDATNSIIGTRVGVRTGEETAYTFIFSHLRTDAELVLLDNETNQTVDIDEGIEYTFFAEPNSMIVDRFQILERDNTPAITTDIDNVQNEIKAHKFIKNNQLYILKNGVLYNATGAVVR